MLPDDANPGGNVHGGTILQMMEQAGMIVATRHCNSDESLDDFNGKKFAGLARFETMAFLQPMFVGELASLVAHIMFTSERSILVKVTVTAENPLTGKKRVTNAGELWYASFVSQIHRAKGETEPLITSVPQVTVPSEEGYALEEYLRGKSLYEARKESEKSPESQNSSGNEGGCLQIEGCLCPACRSGYKERTSATDRSPHDSRQTLCQMVLPGDCGTGKIAFGGFVMKLMDNAAGCCAARHCHTNAVTVSISAMNLVGVVRLGDIVTIQAVATFASAKSLEVSVCASVSSFERQDCPVAHGTFTFVSLNKDGKVAPIPRLALESEDEFDSAFMSQKQYEKNKRERLSKKPRK